MCSLCWLPMAKNHNLWQIFTFGDFCTDPLLLMRAKFCAPYTYVQNFVSIGLFCRPLAAKKPNFCCFWTSAFSEVAFWQQKVEHGCTTTDLPLSNGIKIVSVLQRLHGEIGCTNTDVQQARQTDRQKKSFGSPGGG